jgi:hypothetical protein
MSNIIEWNGILSVKTVQEFSLNSLLNGYILVALQHMPLNMETLTKIEYVNLSFLHPSSHLYFRF